MHARARTHTHTHTHTHLSISDFLHLQNRAGCKNTWYYILFSLMIMKWCLRTTKWGTEKQNQLTKFFIKITVLIFRQIWSYIELVDTSCSMNIVFVEDLFGSVEPSHEFCLNGAHDSEQTTLFLNLIHWVLTRGNPMWHQTRRFCNWTSVWCTEDWLLVGRWARGPVAAA